MKIKRFMSVLTARNKEFVRDRSSLTWNLIMPILLISGFAFAFSGGDKDMFRVGLSSAMPHNNSEFFNTRYIQFIAIEDQASAVVKVERHQLDMLINSNEQRFWINSDSANGYLLEKLLLADKQLHYTKATVSGEEIRYVDWLLPGILGMNMMFSALFGVGYVIVRYRKNGMLKRLKATPLTAFEFLTAQVVSRLWLIMAISMVVYFGTDLFLGFTMNGSYLNLFVVFALGSMCMISLGLLSASRMASEEMAGGLLNLLTWPMMFLSGVWFSLEGSPDILRQFSQLLPLTHVVDATRAIMIDGVGLLEVADNMLVLLLMTLIFLMLSSRFFRWE